MSAQKGNLIPKAAMQVLGQLFNECYEAGLDGDDFNVPSAKIRFQKEVALANARRAAAAPDLLEALQELSSAIKNGRYEDPAYDRIYQALIDAQAAIAKATGK